MEELTKIAEAVARISAPALLAMILIAIWRGWLLVPREARELVRQRDEIRKERDEWRRIALQQSQLARFAVRAAEDRGGNSTGSELEAKNPDRID